MPTSEQFHFAIIAMLVVALFCLAWIVREVYHIEHGTAYDNEYSQTNFQPGYQLENDIGGFSAVYGDQGTMVAQDMGIDDSLNGAFSHYLIPFDTTDTDPKRLIASNCACTCTPRGA